MKIKKMLGIIFTLVFIFGMTTMVEAANYFRTSSTNADSGRTDYPTLAGAILYSNPGATISVILTGADESTRDIVIDKDLKLNLNGYTMDLTQYAITVSSGCTLTIKGSGTLTTSNLTRLITNNGTLKLQHTGTIRNTRSANGYAVYNSGTVQFTGTGTVRSTNYCGIGNTGSSTLTMTNGTIAAKYSISHNSTGELTITGGTIAGTTYGIWKKGSGTVSVSNAIVKATDAGGVAIKIIDTGTTGIVKIGSNDGIIYSGNNTTTSTPIIVGSGYGFESILSGVTLELYDGILLGGTAGISNAGTTSAVSGGILETDTLTYNSTLYNSAYLIEQYIEVTKTDYNGQYDGNIHTFTLTTVPSSTTMIYYSTTTPLTISNYASAGSTIKPGRSAVGTTIVYYYVYDTAGNYTPYSSSENSNNASITITSKIPETSQIEINGMSQNITSDSFTISYSANVDVSGYVCIKNNNTRPLSGDNDWIYYERGQLFTHVLDGTRGDGTHNIYIWTKDLSGNVSQSAVTKQILVAAKLINSTQKTSLTIKISDTNFNSSTAALQNSNLKTYIGNNAQTNVGNVSIVGDAISIGNGKQYLVELNGVTGNGQVYIGATAENFKDYAGNSLNMRASTNIYADNTAPVINASVSGNTITVRSSNNDLRTSTLFINDKIVQIVRYSSNISGRARRGIYDKGNR